MESNNMYKNGIPQFDGQKYAFWSRRMKTYIHAQGFKIWQSIVYGYKESSVLPTSEKEMKFSQNNSKAIKFYIVNPLKRFGKNFKIFMKEIQKSKKQSFKLKEVNSNN
jgi:hypothetical protein